MAMVNSLMGTDEDVDRSIDRRERCRHAERSRIDYVS
jgi:hypothetical protein